jgi:uncharacterized membrane protein YfcA
MLLPSILLIAIALLGSTISGIAGMGGGLILLSGMTFLLPIQSIVPLHGAAQLASNLSRVSLLRAYMHQPSLGLFLLGLPFGSVASYFLLSQSLPSYCFYFAISLSIFAALFKDALKSGLKSSMFNRIFNSPKSFVLAGLLVGFVSLIAGGTGGLLALFFLDTSLKKEQIVATKAAMQIFVHALKIPVYMALGFPFLDWWPLILCLWIASIAGTTIGVKILAKISDSHFQLVFRSALAIAGLRLLYRGTEEVLEHGLF